MLSLIKGNQLSVKSVAKHMSKKAKDLDKFYTHPDIAKTFVDKINEMFPLDQYDMVIEPSAGSETFCSIFLLMLLVWI